MDCGGDTPVNRVADFDGSPNNDGLVLCEADPIVVLAVLGWNKDFGARDAVSNLLSVAATNEDGWLVMVFSGTAGGFPNANGILFGTAVVVDAGLSSEVLPNENGEGAGFLSSAVFWKENDPVIGALSAS